MTYEDVLSFCEEQDVRFIRLSYFDIYGRQKNVSVLPTELKRAFTEGISFDASAIDGFLDEVHSDLISRSKYDVYSSLAKYGWQCNSYVL